MNGSYQDGEVYALTCTGCGGDDMKVGHSMEKRANGTVYQTIIACRRCGAAIRSVLWSEDGRWYTTGMRLPGPALGEQALPS